MLSLNSRAVGSAPSLRTNTRAAISVSSRLNGSASGFEAYFFSASSWADDAIVMSTASQKCDARSQMAMMSATTRSKITFPPGFF